MRPTSSPDRRCPSSPPRCSNASIPTQIASATAVREGATGNVANEDVVYLLHGLGIRTGIDLDKLVDADKFISKQISKASGSRVARALLAKRADAPGS
jgi:hypothetical protein